MAEISHFGWPIALGGRTMRLFLCFCQRGLLTRAKHVCYFLAMMRTITLGLKDISFNIQHRVCIIRILQLINFKNCPESN